MRAKNFIKENLIYIIAFFIPWLIVVVHSIIRDGWLMGGGSILRVDAGLQYYQLCVELWQKVHSGESLFYSWNAGGGFDFYLNFAYYLISPFTLIILLVPKGWIDNAVQVVMILKWSGISISMVYYFMHTKHNQLKTQKALVSFTLGVVFALSNFVIMNVTYFNWNDVLVLFPILLLQIEEMMEGKGWKKYFCLLLLAMLCNFYTAYQVCIFLFFWFLLQMKKETTEKLKKTVIFIGSSVLAAISSMIVIVPCVAGVSNRYSVNAAQEKKEYVRGILTSVTDTIPKLFVFDNISDSMSWNPNLYFSVGAITFVMLYVFIRIKKADKIKYLALCLFLIGSIFIGALSFVWHGFSVPNGIYHRFLYLLIFVCLFMLLKVLQEIRDISLWQILVALIIELTAMVIAFLNIATYLDFYVYLTTILLFVLYQIILVLIYRRSITVSRAIVIFCVLIFVEMSANAVYEFKEYNIAKMEDGNDSVIVSELIKDISLKDGERINITQCSPNMGMTVSKPNTNIFVSYGNGNNIRFYENLGMDAGVNASMETYSASPLVSLMLNIRYGVGTSEVNFSDAELVAEEEGVYLYEMKRLAGLGYMVDKRVSNWEAGASMPFESQNEFVKLATGEEPIFEIIYPEVTCSDVSGNLEAREDYAAKGCYFYTYTSYVPREQEYTSMNFTVEEDMDLYLIANSQTRGARLLIIDGKAVYQDKKTHFQETFHVGNVKKGQNIAIIELHEMGINDENTIWYQFVKFNEENYQKAYEKLSRNVYEIDEMDSDYVKGHITVEEAGLMMTSIQAMDGFTIYVDGIESDYETVGDVMIAVPLTEGDHIVEFKYQTPYVKEGAVASLIGIGIFALLCMADGLRKKKHSGKVEE